VLLHVLRLELVELGLQQLLLMAQVLLLLLLLLLLRPRALAAQRQPRRSQLVSQRARREPKLRELLGGTRARHAERDEVHDHADGDEHGQSQPHHCA